MTQLDHLSLGAYALGVLDDADHLAFSEHLSSCPSCSAELQSMRQLRELLVGVDPDTVPGSRHDAGEGERRGPVTVDRPRRPAGRAAAFPRRTRVLRAAAVVFLVGGVGLGALVTDQRAPAPDSLHSPANHLLLTGERHRATNPANGVQAVVGVEEKGWGTHVALRLAGVEGPLKCRLIAVDTRGHQRVITNWGVPPAGYGVAGSPDPLVVHGGTATTPNEIIRFDVMTTAGETLVSVPVS